MKISMAIRECHAGVPYVETPSVKFLVMKAVYHDFYTVRQILRIGYDFVLFCSYGFWKIY